MRKDLFLYLACLVLLAAACGLGDSSPGFVEPPQTPQQPLGPTPTPTVDLSLVWDVIVPLNLFNLEPMEGLSISGVSDFAWSPDSKSLAVARSQPQAEVALLTRAEFSLISSFNVIADGPLAFSPDGRFLAAALEDRSIKIWNAIYAEDFHTYREHQNRIHGLLFAPQGDVFASAAEEGIRLWFVSSGQPWHQLAPNSDTRLLGFSKDGKTLAGVALQEFTVRWWDVASGNELRTLSWVDHASPVMSGAAISPGETILAWIARNTVLLMDVGTGAELDSIYHSDFVTALDFHPNQNMVVTASAADLAGTYQNVIQFWEIPEVFLLEILPIPSSVTRLAFSPDGKALAVLSSEGVLSLWGLPPK